MSDNDGRIPRGNAYHSPVEKERKRSGERAEINVVSPGTRIISTRKSRQEWHLGQGKKIT